MQPGTRTRAVGALRRIAALAAGLLACAASAESPEIISSAQRGPIEVTRDAIAQATTSVAAVVYKFNEPSMLQSVTRAVERGVEVRLLTAELESRDKRSLVWAAAKAGVEVRVWPEKQGKMHAKYVLVDGSEVLTGSYNWTRSAAKGNFEIAIRFDDAPSVQRFAEIFEEMWGESRRWKR